ncbi:MAG: hypothetical protein AB7S92_14845 [Parvibaculaceae bacterium]
MISAIVKWLTGLSATTWIAAGLVALFALWTWRVYDAGYAAMERQCETAALEARIARLELEIQTRKDADAIEDRSRAELDAENKKLKKVIDAYVEELESRPDHCPLGDDADRLNGL